MLSLWVCVFFVIEKQEGIVALHVSIEPLKPTMRGEPNTYQPTTDVLATAQGSF